MPEFLPQPGDIVKFKKYADSSVAKILAEGQRVRIERIEHSKKDGDSYVVAMLDADGLSTGKGDMVFLEELMPDGPPAKKGKGGHLRVIDVDPATGDALSDADSPAAIEAGLVPFDAPPGSLTLTAGVQAALAEAEDALDAAKTLSKQIESNYFTLGGILAYIYENQAFHLVKGADYTGKRGWQDYIEHELSGLDYRKTMYWISIYRSFSAIGVDETQISKLGGWSKAKEIARLFKARDAQGFPIGERLLADNFERLAGVAADRTREELHDFVEAELEAVRGEPKEKKAEVVARKTFKFRLPEARVEAVTRSLALAREVLHLADDAEALEAVLVEWAENRSDVAVPLEDAVRAMEVRYGVTVKIEEAFAAAE